MKKKVVAFALGLLLVITSQGGVETKAAVTGLSASKVSMKVGETKVIKLYNNKNNVKWIIGSNKVKAVSYTRKNIKIKGMQAGTTYIQAKIGKKRYKCNITVKAKNKSSKDQNTQPTNTVQMTENVTKQPQITAVPQPTTASGIVEHSVTVKPSKMPESSIVPEHIKTAEPDCTEIPTISDREEVIKKYPVAPIVVSGDALYGEPVYERSDNKIVTIWTGKSRSVSDSAISVDHLQYWILYGDGEVEIGGQYIFEPGDETNWDMEQWTFAKEQMKRVHIQEGITGLCSETFFHAKNLEDVHLPDTLERIGEMTFAYCENLKKLYIPQKVTEMTGEMVVSCKGLETIEVSENNAYFGEKDGVLFNKEMTELICYPQGKEDKEYEIPAEVCRIREYSFYQPEHLEVLIIPKQLQYIDKCAVIRKTMKYQWNGLQYDSLEQIKEQL